MHSFDLNESQVREKHDSGTGEQRAWNQGGLAPLSLKYTVCWIVNGTTAWDKLRRLAKKAV
jgi:hypothetical protein